MQRNNGDYVRSPLNESNIRAYVDIQIEEVRQETRRRIQDKMPKNAKSFGLVPEGHLHGPLGSASGIIAYDYVIDDDWNGAEGLVLESHGGATTRIYSTIGGAMTHAATLGSASHRSFLICPGTYAEVVSVTVPTGATSWDIHGVGTGEVIWTPTANSQVLLTLGGTSGNNIRIRGITWSHLTFTGCTAYFSGGSSQRLHFTDCRFTAGVGGGTGLNYTGIQAFLTAQNCTFDGSLTTGVTIATNPQRAVFDGCYFDCVTGATVQGTEMMFSNCVFECSTRAINIGTGDAHQTVIVGNEFSDTGILISCSGTGDIQGLLITGNEFRCSTTHCIDFSSLASSADSDSINVVSNTFRNNGGNGIVLDAQMTSGIVAHNTFEGFTLGNEITGTGGANLDIFHNISDAGALADVGSPVGHLPAAGTAAIVVEKDNSTISAGASILDFLDTDAAAYAVDGSAPTQEVNVPLSQYARLLGRSGGQTLIGSTATGERLNFRANSVDATQANAFLLPAADAGTNTAATNTTLTDSTKAWVSGQWVGAVVTAGGKTMTVTSNTATVLTGASWSGGGNPGSPVAYTIAGSSNLAVPNLAFGPAGLASVDLTLERSSTLILTERTRSTNTPTFRGMQRDDTAARWSISGTGYQMGPGGAAALDTSLNRAAAARWLVTNRITYPSITSPADALTGQMVTYAKSFGGISRMFYQDDSEREIGPLGTMVGTFGTLGFPFGMFQVMDGGGLSALTSTQGSGILGTPTVTAATQSGESSVTIIPTLALTTGATANADASLEWPKLGTAIVSGVLTCYFGISALTNIRVFIGLTDQTDNTMLGSDTPAGEYMGVSFSSSSGLGANWRYVTSDGVTIDNQNSGVAAAVISGTDAPILRMIFETPSTGSAITSVSFSLFTPAWVQLGTTVTMTTNMPGTQPLRTVVGARTLTATDKTFNLAFAYEALAP